MTQHPVINLARRRFTVAEYHRLTDAGILTEDDRVELLYGELVEMSPIKGPHANCVDKLNEWFVLHFHGKAVIRTQNPMTIIDHSEPEPDLLLAKLKDEGYQESHPTPQDALLVIEVADSSLEKDRLVKIPLYASVDIPECWLVSLPEQLVEVHTQPSAQGYAQIHIYRTGDTIESPLVEGLQVSELFS